MNTDPTADSTDASSNNSHDDNEDGDEDDNDDDDDDYDDVNNDDENVTLSKRQKANRARKGQDLYAEFLIDQLNQIKPGANNNFNFNKRGTSFRYAKVSTESKVYWMTYGFLKSVAIALERKSNWFYEQTDNGIKIVSENHEYDELQTVVLKTYYKEVVCGEDIVRVRNGLIQLYLEEDSYHLRAKGDTHRE